MQAAMLWMVLAAGGPALLNPAPPAGFWNALTEADEVSIVQVVPGEAPDWTRASPADEEWVDSLADHLGSGSSYYSTELTRGPIPLARRFDPALRPTFAVRYRRGHIHRDLWIDLDHDRWRWEGADSSVVGVFSARRAALLKLLRAEFPGDTILATRPAAIPSDQAGIPRLDFWASVPVRAARGDTARIVPPRVLELIEPTYPDEARAAHLSGEILVYARVDPDGRVGLMYVPRGPGPLVEAAALSVGRSTFQASTRSGAPRKSWVMVPVSFMLREH